MSPLPSDMTITLGTVDFQTIYPVDDESHPITATVSIDGSALGTSFGSYNSVNKKITLSPSIPSHCGPHTVSILLSDGAMSNTYQFTVTVVCNPPTFGGAALLNQIVHLNNYLEYQLPAITDLDNNFLGNIAATSATATAFLSLTAANQTVHFLPNSFSQVSIHTITITLTDVSGLTSIYTFTAEVINTPPKFVVATLPDLTIHLNTTYHHLLPASYDLENNTIYVNRITTEPWLYSITPSGFTLFTSSYSHLGSHVVTIELFDNLPFQGTQYSFTVTIINTPPIFTKQSLDDQTVKLNEIKTFVLPPYHDDEGNPITVSLKGSLKALGFVQLESNLKNITCNPKSFKLLGSHSI